MMVHMGALHLLACECLSRFRRLGTKRPIVSLCSVWDEILWNIWCFGYLWSIYLLARMILDSCGLIMSWRRVRQQSPSKSMRFTRWSSGHGMYSSAHARSVIERLLRVTDSDLPHWWIRQYIMAHQPATKIPSNPSKRAASETALRFTVMHCCTRSSAKWIKEIAMQ